MHPNDLKIFHDKVAKPRMLQLFEETQIPDGACYIDNLEIEFLDGRSCGFDSHVLASGFIYHNGQVEKYEFDELDVDFSDFFVAHKECIFVSDGQLRIFDDLDEIDLNTRIRNIQTCKTFFSWLNNIPSELKFEMSSIQYEKLKYLFENQTPVSLDLQIESAQNKNKKASVSDVFDKGSKPVLGELR